MAALTNIELTEELKREVGQHFVPGFLGTEVGDDVISLIRDYHVGNIILMKRNVQDIPKTRKLVVALQTIAKEAGHKQPLLIGIDQENGLVSAFSSSVPLGGTLFPGAMALAASGSADLVEKVYAATAKEMRLAGINWAYSPVADINTDSQNPVIGVRAFGDDPAVVASLVSASARGLSSQGIAPSAKHFPGHGDTHVDSHLGLPRILKTKEQLFEAELIPFQKLFSEGDKGTTTIMTGHMALPLVVGDDTPCSLSRVITTDLLRTQLGFSGVVVTDCLEMDAVLDSYGAEKGAVECFKAGADVAMICHTIGRQVGAVKETYAAVVDGRLNLDELKASGKRVETLKKAVAGTWEEALNPDVPGGIDALKKLKEEHLALSKDAYARCITIVRDDTHILPLPLPSSPSKFLLFTPEQQVLNRAVDDAENIIRTADGKVRNTAGPSYSALGVSISAQVGADVEHVVVTNDGVPTAEVESLVKSAETIVFATRNADGEKSRWQLSYLKHVLALLGPGSETRVVVLASCGPYELGEDLGKEVAYVACYEFTVPALSAATLVLFGETKASGKCPVVLG